MPRPLAVRDHLREVVPHLIDRQAAQPVVGAEFEHEHLDVAVERPVEPTQAAGRRVARHARVDHLHVEPGRRRSSAAPAPATPGPASGRGRRSGCRRARRRAAVPRAPSLPGPPAAALAGAAALARSRGSRWHAPIPSAPIITIRSPRRLMAYPFLTAAMRASTSARAVSSMPRCAGRQARCRSASTRARASCRASSSLSPFGLGRRHLRRRVGQPLLRCRLLLLLDRLALPATRHGHLQEHRNSGTQEFGSGTRESGTQAEGQDCRIQEPGRQSPDFLIVPVLL